MNRNDITTLVWDGPCAVTESRYGIAIGWYTDCDTALCRDCVPDADAWARGDYASWDGFESWEDPDVMAQWWDAYGEDEYALDHGDLCEIIRRAMAARGCSEYVPATDDIADAARLSRIESSACDG